MRLSKFLFAAALLSSLSLPTLSQDNVTISKSRLEELERKEKELEKLKGDQNKPKPASTATQSAPVTAPAVSVPVVTYQSPAISTLPPFKEGETVEAMDLANYYHSDAAAADQRYRKAKLAVRGEIVGFEKPLLRREYRVLLKTPSQDTKVICDLIPPQQFSAVFTVNHGAGLVGLQGETRVPLAKVGDVVVVQGVCKGLHDSLVMIYATRMTPAK